MARQKETEEKKVKKEKRSILKRREKEEKNSPKVQRVLTTVFIVLLVLVVVRGGVTFFDLKGQQNEVEEKYETMQQEKKELQATLKYINTPEYVEQAARDMLKMVMPGEVLYVMKDQEGTDAADTDSPDAADGDSGDEGAE